MITKLNNNISQIGKIERLDYNEVERVNISCYGNTIQIQIVHNDNTYSYITLWGVWDSENKKFNTIKHIIRTQE